MGQACQWRAELLSAPAPVCPWRLGAVAQLARVLLSMSWVWTVPDLPAGAPPTCTRLGQCAPPRETAGSPVTALVLFLNHLLGFSSSLPLLALHSEPWPDCRGRGPWKASVRLLFALVRMVVPGHL